jgi:hypothetical protein
MLRPAETDFAATGSRILVGEPRRGSSTFEHLTPFLRAAGSRGSRWSHMTENLATTHPMVMAATVIGAPDEDLGEVVKASATEASYFRVTP